MDRRADRNIDAAERPQNIGPADGYRTYGYTGLESEMPYANLERTKRATAGVTAFREHQYDATSGEELIHGSQPSLVELALVW